MEASEQFCLRWNNHQQNLRTTMAEQYKNQIFTDVTLGVEDGHSVRCHKMILAASSRYFQSIFVDFPYEHPIVVLNDVKYKEITAILEYMYKGEVNVPGSELPALFKVAEALEIKGLVGGSKESPARQLRQPEVGDGGVAETAEFSESVGGPEERSRPSGSGGSPYRFGGESPVRGDRDGADASPPAWPFSQGFPPEGRNPTAAAAALQSSLSARYSSLLGSPYNESGPEAFPRRRRRRKMSGIGATTNPGTPTTRTALDRTQVDGSRGMPLLRHIGQGDSHRYQHRVPSNGSESNETEDKHGGADAPNSQPTHSPYESETSMADEDDNGLSRRSLSEDTNAGTGNCGSASKLGAAKRYKQYTHTDIAGAIAAVLENGMSANKAAVMFRVPSRTLYDKISRAKRAEELRNCGAGTSKRKRNASSGGACFPYGIGANAAGGIYGNYSESENDNGSLTMDDPASVLETTLAESRDDSIDRDANAVVGGKSPSPRLPVDLQVRHCEESENEAEDLSVSRKSDVRVAMPPSSVLEEPI